MAPDSEVTQGPGGRKAQCGVPGNSSRWEAQRSPFRWCGPVSPWALLFLALLMVLARYSLVRISLCGMGEGTNTLAEAILFSLRSFWVSRPRFSV